MTPTATVAFEAVLPAGRLRLALPTAVDAPAPQDVIDAALLLARHEALVQALEPWLQAAIVPQPCTATADNALDPLIWASTDGGVQLGFDWALLSSIDPATAPPLPLQWQALAFSVEVARLDRAPWPQPPASSPHEPTAPGVLLLPPSFAPSWRVQLQGALLATEAEWGGPGNPLMLSGAPQLRDQSADANAWLVYIDTPCSFTPPQLLGWDASLPAPLSADASLHSPQGQRWPGRIAPALGGAGLWL
jgi:hypothetical protein